MTDAIRDSLTEAVRLFESYGLIASPLPDDDFGAGRWINAARAALAATPAVGEERIPLADHDEIGRKVLGQPWAIQSAIVTIAAHCTVLTDKYPTGDVADLAGCISECCLELANALAAEPASPLRGIEDLAPSPCSDLSIGELIEWLDNPQWTNGYLNSDAANHMSAAAELIERLVSSAPPEQPAADPVTGRETIREIVHANAKTTLIGFNEISDQNVEFICDQISRKVELAFSHTTLEPRRSSGEPVWLNNDEANDLDKGSDA